VGSRQRGTGARTAHRRRRQERRLDVSSSDDALDGPGRTPLITRRPSLPNLATAAVGSDRRENRRDCIAVSRHGLPRLVAGSGSCLAHRSIFNRTRRGARFPARHARVRDGAVTTRRRPAPVADVFRAERSVYRRGPVRARRSNRHPRVLLNRAAAGPRPWHGAHSQAAAFSCRNHHPAML
jgi:hypothetical protein